jgi:hypothetical protein
MTTLRITRPGLTPDEFVVDPGVIAEVLKRFVREHPQYKGREKGIVRLNDRYILPEQRTSMNAGPNDVITLSRGEVHTLSPDVYRMI